MVWRTAEFSNSDMGGRLKGFADLDQSDVQREESVVGSHKLYRRYLGAIPYTLSSVRFDPAIWFPMTSFSTLLTVVFVVTLFFTETAPFRAIISSADFVFLPTNFRFRSTWFVGSTSLIFDTVGVEDGFTKVVELLIVGE